MKRKAIKTSQVINASEVKVDIKDEIGIRDYESKISYYGADLTNLVYCLAVFCTKDNQIYKLSVIDYRGNRYELAGEKITKWATFKSAELFIFTQKDQFDYYYDQYIKHYEGQKPKSKETILTWLSKDQNRIGIQEK